jgi:microsomal prostaglandin-E synthase 1
MTPLLQEYVILQLPGFKLYALCSILLVLKMVFVIVTTARTRARLKVSLNPEDAAAFGAQLVTTEHPEVERVLRVHRNDLENIPSFWLLGLLAVLAGAPTPVLYVALPLFTVSRYLHMVAYLKAVQPWRSVSFGLGLLANLALVVAIVYRILTT